MSALIAHDSNIRSVRHQTYAETTNHIIVFVYEPYCQVQYATVIKLYAPWECWIATVKIGGVA